MAIYSIKDLEKLSGIQAHTIRIWEKRYQLVRPKRTVTNIRVYTDEDLRRLLNVAILNNNGFKISKIAQLSENEVKEKILHLTEDANKSENQIDALVLSMIELNEQKFEKILSRLVLQTGFEETIETVIYPFLNKIGVLWQTGNINPAHEHFVSNLIRQKLFVAIDSILTDESPKPKRFTLFLPEGELHEIGLLFFAYLIKKKGHHVIYLGQSVPFKDLLDVHKTRPADYLVTSVTTPVPPEMMADYLEALSSSFPNIQILLAGSHFEPEIIKKYTNLLNISSPHHLKDFLQNLNQAN